MALRAAAAGHAHQVPGLVEVAAGRRLLAHRVEDRPAELPVPAGLSQPQPLNLVRLGERGPWPAGVRQAPGQQRGLGGSG